MKISIVIPAYNQEREIGHLVSQIKQLGFDVVVVDDGSDDATADAAKKAGAIVIKHEKNLGKGAAIRTGLEYISKTDVDALILMDGDGQHSPLNIKSLIQKAQESEASLIIGNRMDDTRSMPFLRKCANAFMSLVLSIMAKQKVRDSQSGFRLLKRALFEKLKLKTANFEIESEMIIKASRMGFKISSVPIKTIYRGQASLINPLLDTPRFIKLVINSIFSNE